VFLHSRQIQHNNFWQFSIITLYNFLKIFVCIEIKIKYLTLTLSLNLNVDCEYFVAFAEIWRDIKSVIDTRPALTCIKVAFTPAINIEIVSISFANQPFSDFLPLINATYIVNIIININFLHCNIKLYILTKSNHCHYG